MQETNLPKFLKNLLVMIFWLTLLNPMAAQIMPGKFGKGLQVEGKDSTFFLKIGFRFQNLATANWTLADDNGGLASFDANAIVRRSRLKFDGWAHVPNLTYKLELSLSNRDNGGGGDKDEFGNAANIILDAALTYKFHNNLYIKFGQAKLAGNRERVISSGNLQFVDRSRLNSRFTIDRDMYLQLGNSHVVGDNFLIRESASIASGEGKNHLTGYNGGFGYTFRLEMLPFGTFQSKGDYVGSAVKREESPKLALGVTYDLNKNAIRERGQKGSFITDSFGNYVGKDLNTFFADFMFKYKGWSVMGEYADKDTDDGVPFVLDDEDIQIGRFYTGSGLNLAVGYLLPSNIEFAARYTTISADTSTDEKHYTIGLNKFFVGHKLKIQTDFSLINRVESQNTALWRTQVDIHF